MSNLLKLTQKFIENRTFQNHLLPLILAVLTLVLLNGGAEAFFEQAESHKSQSLILNANFNQVGLQGWSTDGGKWRVTSGHLTQSDAGQAMLIREEWVATAGMYTLATRLELDDQTNEIGIVFNAQYPATEQQHRVTVQRTGSIVTIRAGYQNENGEVVSQTEKSIFVPEAKPIDLRIFSDTLMRDYEIWVNGREVISDLPLVYLNGMPGLYATGTASFDSFSVKTCSTDIDLFTVFVPNVFGWNAACSER